MMLAAVHVRHAVHTVRLVAVMHTGHVTFYAHDAKYMSSMLPNLPSMLPLLIVRAHDVPIAGIAHVDFVVRPEVIRVWLKYLIENCPHYANVEVDEAFLAEMDERAETESAAKAAGAGAANPAEYASFNIADEVQSVVSSEWDLRPFAAALAKESTFQTAMLAAAGASTIEALQVCKTFPELETCSGALPAYVGAFDLGLQKALFESLKLLLDQDSLGLAELSAHICKHYPGLGASAATTAIALCFLCKPNCLGSSIVKGARLGMHKSKHASCGSGSSEALVASVLQHWAGASARHAACAALQTWEEGGVPSVPVRVCGPLCMCTHEDSCCCAGRLCQSSQQPEAAGAAVLSGGLPEPRGSVDDEASMLQDMVPSGGQFENQSEVAEALGLDEPKAPAASARPKRKRPPTVVRDLSFQDTNIGLDADEMGMPISSYPGLGLAAAPVVAKPAGPNCAAESAATATKPVDTRKRLSLFNDDIRGLVQLSFPTLVHNKSFDLFCADESVSELDMLRHLMAYCDESGHMPFLEHPNFMYCMLNVLWRRQNNRMKSRVVDRNFQGMSLSDFRAAAATNDKVLKQIRSVTAGRPGSTASWWRFKRQVDNFRLHWRKTTEIFAPKEPAEVPDQDISIFYTLSAADAWWPVFHTQCTPGPRQPLESNSGTTGGVAGFAEFRERSRKVRHYVGLASQYFHWKHQCFLNGFMRAAWGIHAAMWRVEMQKRAAAHYHGAAMLRDAPTRIACMRACDAFQQHNNPDPKPNREREFKPEQEPALWTATGAPRRPVGLDPDTCSDAYSKGLALWDSVIEVVHYCDSMLGLTAWDPLKCLCKSRPKNMTAVKTHMSTVEVEDWDTVYSELLHEAFKHRHSRAYCLRLRKHKSEQTVEYSVQNAPRGELKCRFEAPWPACNCKACQSGVLRRGQAACQGRVDAGGAQTSCEWSEGVEVLFNCTCNDHSDGHQCKCDSKCHQGCHVHVTRNKTDENARRHFRMYPCRNNSMLNCHVREAALVAGSNIDIQFLLDPLKAVEYMAKYMCKDEPSNPELVRNMRAAVAAYKPPAWASEGDSSGLKALVSSLLNSQSGGRAYGMWEVAFLSQGIPLFGFSGSKADLRMSGSCSLKPLEEDSDEEVEDADVAERVLSNDFQWYNSRPQTLEGDPLYDTRSAYTDKFKARQAACWVNVIPRLWCKLPAWGAELTGPDACPEVAHLENWCQQQLLLFRPWRVSPGLKGQEMVDAAVLQVKDGHADCLAAVTATLPRWLQTFEAQLENRDSPLVSPPKAIDDWGPGDAAERAKLTHSQNLRLPRIVASEYHQALAEKGYAPGAACESESFSESDTESEGQEVSSDEDACGDSDFDSDDPVVLEEDPDQHNELHEAYENEAVLLGGHLAASMAGVLASNAQVGTIADPGHRAKDWLQAQKKEAGDDPMLGPGDVADPSSLDANPWQKELFDYVLDAANCGEQVFVIAQGEGGTGKSHVIKCWRHDDALAERMLVLAPTGIAALGVKGRTIAFALGFYPGKAYLRCNADTKDASKASELLKKVQALLEDVDVIVVDERSMVGRGVHGMLKTRLEEAFPDRGEYGGISIVWLGDDAQLPPVRACKMQDDGLPKAKVRKQVDAQNAGAAGADGVGVEDVEAQSLRVSAKEFELIGKKAWEDHFQPVWVKSVAAVSCKCKVFHLVQNVRAKDSPELLHLTTAIRNGEITSAEISTLAARNLQTLPDAEKVEFASGVTIVDTQAKRVHANARALASLCAATSHPALLVHSIDEWTKGKACTEPISTSLAGGLQKDLYLAVGARVMCTDNLWTSRGLVNGAIGEVKAITFPDGWGAHPIVWVDFPSYCGPEFDVGAGTLVPIVAVKRQLSVKLWNATLKKKMFATRTQLPLQLAQAITIHKSQGMTIGPNKPLRKVVIDVGEGESWCEGLAYVAVSRGMFIDTFALDPMRPPKRWMDIGKSAGGKRTQRWLRLLELVAAVQHLERCATHSTACRVCQHIKKGGGARADPVLQSLLQSKDSKLHTN